MITMVANAWYPVNYFRLSFGKSESLYDAILTLQRENNIPINLGIRELTCLLQELIQQVDIRKQLNFLQKMYHSGFCDHGLILRMIGKW